MHRNEKWKKGVCNLAHMLLVIIPHEKLTSREPNSQLKESSLQLPRQQQWLPVWSVLSSTRLWSIKGNPTLRELIKWLVDKGLDAYSIPCGSCLLFNNMFPRHMDQMDKKVVDLARDVAKMEIPPYRRHLDLMVACEDEEENDIDIPQISVYFR